MFVQTSKYNAFTLTLHPQVDLEHTELLTDVGETLGLLRFVVNDVESDSLGKRSTIKPNYKEYLH